MDTASSSSDATRAVVHVWAVPLRQPMAAVDAAARLLAPDEHARAARFHFARDRDRFIVARAALRRILGGCLGVEPAAVQFAYSAAGKPDLAPVHEARDRLSFNLSHSHELAVVAVAGGAPLGVDVEHQREVPDLLDLARRFFAPGEAAQLLRLPPEEQPGAFFRCWTRKEANLKATGDGIAAGLDRFEVAFAPGEPAALRRTDDDPAEAARWSIIDLALEAGYAGAVAVRAVGVDVRVEGQPRPSR